MNRLDLFANNYKIILMSGSPRRKELLSDLFSNLAIFPSCRESAGHYITPHRKVMEIAKSKSADYLPKTNELVISCDTLVYKKGKYYGKPKDRNDAFCTLKELSNSTHYVYSGVCLKSAKKTIVFYEKSAVIFAKLSDEDINRYLDQYKPYDKAGSYGIQDGNIVKKYIGSYSNIVGLPMEKLEQKIIEFFQDEEKN